MHPSQVSHSFPTLHYSGNINSLTTIDALGAFFNNLDDPQDAVVAQMYKNDIDQFNRKAAEWTQNYAREVTMDDKVQHLMEMGFAEDQCREALERANGDQTVALNYLLQ